MVQEEGVEKRPPQLRKMPNLEREIKYMIEGDIQERQREKFGDGLWKKLKLIVRKIKMAQRCKLRNFIRNHLNPIIPQVEFFQMGKAANLWRDHNNVVVGKVEIGERGEVKDAQGKAMKVRSCHSKVGQIGAGGGESLRDFHSWIPTYVQLEKGSC